MSPSPFYLLVQFLLLTSILFVSSEAQGDSGCDLLTAQGEHEGKVEPPNWRLEYKEFQREMRNRLTIEAKSTTPQRDRIRKESYSLEHQESLQKRIAKVAPRFRNTASKIGERTGKTFQEDLEAAVGDSDKGKQETYNEMIWRPTNKSQLLRSNTFLDFVSLRSTKDPLVSSAQKILEEVLISDFDGRPGEGLQPKRFSNDEIRATVKENFFLVGGLHDQPGIYDAFLEFAAYSDAPRFRNRLRYNISHNGPGRNINSSEGFWGLLFNALIPGQLTKNGKGDYFEGTVYWKNGKMRYPEGSSVGWFLHTATDRLSGEVNLLKFMAEAPAENMVQTLATSYNAVGVIQQFKQLQARLKEVGNRFEKSELEDISQYIDSLRLAQQAYANAIAKRAKFGVLTGGNHDRMEILNDSGAIIATYEWNRVDNVMLLNGAEISRAQFFERLTHELFVPVRDLDPLKPVDL